MKKGASSGSRARAAKAVSPKSGTRVRKASLVKTANEEALLGNNELRRTKEQLQNANAELAGLLLDLSGVLSGVGIPIVILDSERRIRHLTRSAAKLLGLTPRDVGRPIGRVRIHVRLPRLDDLISVVIASGEEQTREVQAKSGRWYVLRIHPLRSDSRIERVLMAFRGVQKFREGQGAEKGKDFIGAILDAAKDLLITVLDREGRIIYFNGACQRLSGYSEDEVRGRRLWDFLLLPEEVESVKATFRKVLAGKAVQRENYWVAKDGQHLLISFSHSAATNDDRVESVIKTGIDISAREEANQRAEESEATVSALMENAIQAILACDAEGRIVLANAVAEKMFGYQRNELLGRRLESLLPERFREQHTKHRATWFANPTNRPMGSGLDLAGVHKDASEFPVDVSLSYVGTRAGTLAIAFVTDLTEKKKSERTLLEYRDQLQKLTGALLTAQENGNRQVARELHDVFSQELAAAGMEISSLKKEAKSADIAARLSELGKKIGRLAADIHRTSRELHPAIIEELGLEPALRQECEIFQQRSGIPAQFIVTDVPEAIPQEAALCLYRVAQESLRNIQQHAPESDTVRITLAGSKGGLTVRITDTGDGFDLDQALKKGGLGLISMEERVRLVRGKLTVESEPGRGTTVTAFVPL